MRLRIEMSNITHTDHEHCRGCETVAECIEARRKLGITDQDFLNLLKSNDAITVVPGEKKVSHQDKCKIIKKMSENAPDKELPIEKPEEKPEEKKLKATEVEIANFEKNFMQ